MFRRTCIFASSMICGSHSAFQCVWGTKRQCTNFHVRVGPIQLPQKARRDTLRRTSVLHPVGSAGHIVHSSASRVQNINVLFFMLGWELYGFHKKRARSHYTELVFLYPVGSVGHVTHSSGAGMRKVDALFFILRWDRYGFHRKHTWTYCTELMFFDPSGICGSCTTF
jgi:hypothetical protein